VKSSLPDLRWNCLSLDWDAQPFEYPDKITSNWPMKSRDILLKEPIAKIDEAVIFDFNNPDNKCDPMEDLFTEKQIVETDINRVNFFLVSMHRLTEDESKTRRATNSSKFKAQNIQDDFSISFQQLNIKNIQID
jgi:hypothetical protein